MHILQPKHELMNEEEVNKLLEQHNISKAQLPKIHLGDSALPEGCEIGNVIKIERKDGKEVSYYYRVVV